MRGGERKRPALPNVHTHAPPTTPLRPVRRSLVNGLAPVNMPRAAVAMKAEIVLADKETEQAIMAVVNAEPAKTKSAAMCSQMAAANLRRITADEADGGSAAMGPPFTEASGLGWDVSTEPKVRTMARPSEDATHPPSDPLRFVVL